MRLCTQTSLISVGTDASCARWAISSRNFFQGKIVNQAVNNRSKKRHGSLVVLNFKFLKDLGLKKPAFLPDFGLEKRKTVLETLFTTTEESSLNSILAEDLQVSEPGQKQPLGKADWVDFVSKHIVSSLDDFSWSHITSGDKDEEGYSIVQVQVVGRFSGQPYSVPNSSNPSIKSTGQRVKLDEQTLKVKVEDGLVKEIRFLGKQGAGPLGLYQALSGKDAK